MTDRRVLRAFLGAFVLTVLAGGTFLAVADASEENVRLLLRISARMAFVVLLVVFVARPLRDMFHTPLTLSLLRNRALFGAAFAGIHTGHLALLVLRVRMFPDFDLFAAGNIPGALTYLLIYAMLLTTFSGPRRAIGPGAWRVLHKLGLFWLIYAFAQTQLPESVDDLSGMNWWLVALLIAALIVRMTAWFAKLGGCLQNRSN